MKKLILYHCHLRRAPLLVRAAVAVAVLLVAALIKEALRPAWAHFHLAPFTMDLVVTLAEFPVVVFFASPVVRGLPSSSAVFVRRAPLVDSFAEPNPFSLRLTDELNLIPERDQDET